jgi:hypothetical protein
MDLHNITKEECYKPEHRLLWNIQEILKELIPNEAKIVNKPVDKPVNKPVNKIVNKKPNRIKDLYPLAKKLGIPKYATMSTDDLISKIKEKQS